MVRVGENHTQHFTRNKVVVSSDFKKIFGKYLERLYGLYLLYEDIVKNKCCKLREPRLDKSTNFERLVEGIAIQVALTWELFVRNVYLLSIVDYPDEFMIQCDNKITKYKDLHQIRDANWKPQRPEEVEEILLIDKEDGYLSFRNTSHIKEKAGAHISRKEMNKNPFLLFDKEIHLLDELNRFSKLRNYLVHRSSKSKREFKEAFTVDGKEPRSPGEFLNREIKDRERSQRYNEEYELGYFIMIFKESLYKMAEVKSIGLPDWPQSYQDWLEKTLPVIKELMGENLNGGR